MAITFRLSAVAVAAAGVSLAGLVMSESRGLDHRLILVAAAWSIAYLAPSAWELLASSGWLKADPMRPGKMGSFVTKRHREEFREAKAHIAGHEAWLKTQKEIARRNRRVKAAGAQKPKTKAASKPVRKKVRR